MVGFRRFAFSLAAAPARFASLTLVVGACLVVAPGMQAQSTTISAQSAPAKPALLRYALADNDTIWIGRPIGRFANYATVATDSLVRIPTPLFEGADGLLVIRDSANVVQRIVFLFNEKRNIDQMMKDQFSDFGRETGYSTAPVPDGIRESWRWIDKRTEFTIARFTPAQNQIAALVIIATFRNDPP